MVFETNCSGQAPRCSAWSAVLPSDSAAPLGVFCVSCKTTCAILQALVKGSVEKCRRAGVKRKIGGQRWREPWPWISSYSDGLRDNLQKMYDVEQPGP